MDKSNVIDFMERKWRKDYPLFNPELRAKLEHSMGPFTSNPSDAVTTAEQVICAHVVSSVRGWASEIGSRIGNRIADDLFGKG